MQFFLFVYLELTGSVARLTATVWLVSCKCIGEITDCLLRNHWESRTEIIQIARQVAGNRSRQQEHGQRGSLGFVRRLVRKNEPAVERGFVRIFVRTTHCSVELLTEDLQCNKGTHFARVEAHVRQRILVHAGEAGEITERIDHWIHREERL